LAKGQNHALNKDPQQPTMWVLEPTNLKYLFLMKATVVRETQASARKNARHLVKGKKHPARARIAVLKKLTTTTRIGLAVQPDKVETKILELAQVSTLVLTLISTSLVDVQSL
jgi:hypothetical protein